MAKHAYALNHWTQLTLYLDAGRLEIDNNGSKRAIRSFTVGRKNWLFMGKIKGAQSSASLYSLIETARANGIKPYQYLRYVLKKMPNLQPDQFSHLLALELPFISSTDIQNRCINHLRRNEK